MKIHKASGLMSNIHVHVSGQDRYGVMTRVYYKDAHAAVIVMDSTREQTIDGALRWKTDLDQKINLTNGEPIPTILLANKNDLPNSITDDKLEELQRDHGFVSVVRVSAKTNLGIDEAFSRLVDVIETKENNGFYSSVLFNRDGNVRLGEAHNKKREINCCYRL
ncbi:unnamed protein product [Auanema sp. JU1783]|nr:unnamed protein product [Auanema sp. JU1783]